MTFYHSFHHFLFNNTGCKVRISNRLIKRSVLSLSSSAKVSFK